MGLAAALGPVRLPPNPFFPDYRLSTSRVIVVGSVAILLLIFFAPALGGGYGFVFRDAAHFYRPMFEFIRDEWLAGRVPLWNPYENIGMPLVGESTSSVFYPGKLIFVLPLDYALLYNSYIVAHVALAAWGAYLLARHWQVSTLAAGMAALSYAFSGSVLFQYCNVVFLVGAAWLPFALLLAERALGRRSLRDALGFGAILALMIAGGDPQMAYNAGLLATLYALSVWRMGHAEQADRPARLPWFSRRPVLLAVSATTCLLLAAVQMLPTAEASRASGRGLYDAPRSVFELASYLVRQGEMDSEPPDDPDATWYSGLLDTSPNGHQRHIYQFSVGPWRAWEFFWPNLSGRQFPTQRRWLNALPAEGRVWVPSLYMGLLPFLLAIMTWSLRRRAPLEVRLWSWIVVIGALSSLGIYGPAWAMREIKTWCGGSDTLGVGDEVGGLYWFLTVVVPGYAYFRYSAKMLGLASLGLSLLAARGWDDAWQTAGRKLCRWLMVLAIISLLGIAVLMAIWPTVADRLVAMPADALFGPFDSNGAWRDILTALSQTAVLSVVLLAVFSRSATHSGRSWLRVAAIGLTVVDLAIAQRWLVAYAPESDWRFEPRVVSVLPVERSDYRVYREGHGLPDAWAHTSSPDRQSEALRWDRETLWPKYQLPYGIPLADVSGSIMPSDYQLFWQVAREQGERGPVSRLPHASVLDLLAVRFAILFGHDLPDHCQRLADPAEGTQLCSRATAQPRAWIVHQVEQLPSLRAHTLAGIKQRTQEVLFPNGAPRDWSQVAVVEADEPVLPRSAPPAEPRDESCQIRHADPLRVELDVRLTSPGLVVLSDFYYPGWQCTFHSGDQEHRAPILRCNRLMRGVALPAGVHRVNYRYRPPSVEWGAAISGFSVLALAIAAIVDRLRRRGEKALRAASPSI